MSFNMELTDAGPLIITIMEKNNVWEYSSNGK